MQDEIAKPDYFWGLSHGDFHPGQMMYNTDGSGDLALLDWEFTGIFGNPGVDLATWIWESAISFEDIQSYENDLLTTYYHALIDGGVKP
jgi:aminoglycoside phosphotransferase (APT) family kinase protein